jgi:hypothetical protein
VIIVKPRKNNGPALNRNSTIHPESGIDMTVESAGTNRKNMVTKPLSLLVVVNAT